MASQYLTDLLARRDAAAAELARLSPATLGGLANSSGGGESIDHQGHKRSLYDELKMLDEMITRQREIEGIEGSGPSPFFHVSGGR